MQSFYEGPGDSMLRWTDSHPVGLAALVCVLYLLQLRGAVFMVVAFRCLQYRLLQSHSRAVSFSGGPLVHFLERFSSSRKTYVITKCRADRQLELRSAGCRTASKGCETPRLQCAEPFGV